MKATILSILLLVLGSVVFAQKSAVTSAANYLKDGFLDDAKKSIDKAEKNPATANWYKTFYYKGQIYHELGISKKPKYKALCSESCLKIAYESYLKAIQLNFTKEEYRQLNIAENEDDFMRFVKIISHHDDRNYEDTEVLLNIITNFLPALSNGFINNGIAKYQEGDYKASHEEFTQAVDISIMSMQVDTQLYYSASLAALKAGEYKDADKYSEMLIRLNYGKGSKDEVVPYQNCIAARKATNDTAGIMKIIEKGIAECQYNYPLYIEAYNYYVGANNPVKALEYISRAIETEPNNAQFIVIRGNLAETLKQKDKAIADYQKALTLDPENYDANYSIGAFYYNAGVDTIAWSETNIPITDFKKSEEFQIIAKELFKKALPFLEKARSLQPDNINVLQTLKTIYYRDQQMDKYTDVDNKIKSMTE